MKVDDFTSTLDNPYWALVVGVIAVARLGRLVVFDEYPPMLWLRIRYKAWCGETGWKSKWSKLVDCAFCAAPYLAALDMAFAYFTDFHWSWWLVNSWLAISYVAAIIVARDEPPE